ncbi:LytR/AlgR family response regulator transcription factor, partial [Bacteroidota bacterium]
LKHNIKVIFGISLGLFFLLLFLQPFGIEEINEDMKIYIIAGFGGITALAFTLNLIIVPSIIPVLFKEEKWKIKKEILWNLWIFITLCAGYFFFSYYSEWFNMDFASIFKISLISTIPVIILVTINQDRFTKIDLRSALELNKLLMKKETQTDTLPEKERICIDSDSGKDNFEEELDNLLFIRSANNYVEIYWKKGDDTKKILLRTSLQKAADKLTIFPKVYKCHRTCVVNIENINKVLGSSQNCRLLFDGVDEEIPVSRNYSKELIEKYKSYSSGKSA